jgi:hypothetical protein
MDFLGRLEGIAEGLNPGKRYHYDKPLNERVASRVFRFWGRMIFIGLAFPAITMIAVVAGALLDDKAQEETMAEREQTSKPNPWSLAK